MHVINIISAEEVIPVNTDNACKVTVNPEKITSIIFNDFKT